MPHPDAYADALTVRQKRTIESIPPSVDAEMCTHGKQGSSLLELAA